MIKDIIIIQYSLRFLFLFDKYSCNCSGSIKLLVVL